jgi:galactose-1-phosphate uridylyltransferase
MPELRKDPVIGRWVIISTERGRRLSEFLPEDTRGRASFCPLCEGNEDKTPPEIFAIRENGSSPNSTGWTLRVVPNKFPALRIEGELNRHGEGLYDKMNGVGAHGVVVETPKHDENLSTLPQAPYNFMLHTGNTDGTNEASYHWHREIIPRLTKVAGFEWGTGFYINPTPPEDAARYLREALPREVPGSHT